MYTRRQIFTCPHGTASPLSSFVTVTGAAGAKKTKGKYGGGLDVKKRVAGTCSTPPVGDVEVVALELHGRAG